MSAISNIVAKCLIISILLFSANTSLAQTTDTRSDIQSDFKPQIEYVKILKIEQQTEQQTYDVYFEVKYSGADYITTEIEEEFSTWTRTEFIDEASPAKGVCQQITAPFKAWINFSVRNDYGFCTYTVEFDPYGKVVDTRITSDITDIMLSEQIKHVEVYNINGTSVGIFNSIPDSIAALAKGCYILRMVYASGKVTVKKFIK
ncbi:MAG: T9SS type A sorting domain-containing protein [Muribaculaceae bacterium]|nr:T9SS type A sorting domain-containing protein [Muribaculaceae bacterium]